MPNTLADSRYLTKCAFTLDAPYEHLVFFTSLSSTPSFRLDHIDELFSGPLHAALYSSPAVLTRHYAECGPGTVSLLSVIIPEYARKSHSQNSNQAALGLRHKEGKGTEYQ